MVLLLLLLFHGDVVVAVVAAASLVGIGVAGGDDVAVDVGVGVAFIAPCQ